MPILPGQDPELLLLNCVMREELMMRQGDKGFPGMWREVYAGKMSLKDSTALEVSRPGWMGL